MKTYNLLLVVMLFSGIIFTSCNADDDMPQNETSKNIVETAMEAGQFSILIEAAQKAGLANYLSTESDITVFAPTDDAFVALLGDLGLNSLDDIDAQTLGNILKYHVVAGAVYSYNLSPGVVPSLNDQSPSGDPVSLMVSITGRVYINNAMVSTADVMASNGVIHVIDKVLLPPTVVDLATFSSDFSSLVSAVVKADLATALSSEGPFTVFAPTNDAFSSLFNVLGISGLDDLTAEDLAPILTYHVVEGNVLSTDLTNGMVGTLNAGKNVSIDLSGGVNINESSVVLADIQGTNGVIHVIDKVLIPE